jgi:hypothetical protein
VICISTSTNENTRPDRHRERVQLDSQVIIDGVSVTGLTVPHPSVARNSSRRLSTKDGIHEPDTARGA